ncbi:hypothetical protein ACYSNW_10705 [Enterococcus sp. LJL99]
MKPKKIILYFEWLIILIFLLIGKTTFAVEDSSVYSDSITSTTVAESTQSSASSRLNKTSENTDSSTSSESTETSEETSSTSETTQSLDQPKISPRAALLATTGDGSQSNPFLVGNETDLVAALAATPAGGGSLYIQLTADITGTNWAAKFQFIQNSVIDGNGHSFLYQGTNYTGYQFYVSNKPNLTVTYKNVNFGSQEYPNSNYYGIMHTVGSSTTNFTLNIENVNYYVINGAQPFQFAGGTGSSINFSGTNNFQMPNATGTGGEFTEGVQNVTVKQGSKTTINHLNNQETIFFRANGNAGQMHLTIENNASLEIQSIKRYMFTASAQPQITVGQNAHLKYNRINATNNFDVNSNSSGATLNFGENSTGVFQNTGTIDTGSNASNFVVNANHPNYIIFRDTTVSGTGSFLSATNRSIQFNRTDSTTTNAYSLLALGRDNQLTTLNTFQPSSTYTLLGSTVTNHSGVVYQEDLSIENSVSAISDTSSNASNIDAHIEQITPANRDLTNVTYKLGSQRLFSSTQTITDATAQTAITNATTGTSGFIQQKDIPITGSTGSNFNLQTATAVQFEQLKPGTYYLYTRLSEIIGKEDGSAPVAGFGITTKWVETQVDVSSVINVSFPVESLNFNTSKVGTFGKAENVDGGAKITNNSNVPIGVTLQSVKENEENTVKLVDSFSSLPNQELILRLNTTYDSSGTNGPIWGPLSDDYSGNQELNLQEFWQGNTAATIFLDGNYSGPLTSQQKVNYQFTFYYEDLSQ